MKTWHLHIRGQVQGVGFRPFIYRLAKDMALEGWVNNTSDGVHLEINTSKTQLDDFVGKVYQFAPPLARITGHQAYKIDTKKFSGFRILPSEEYSFPNLHLTPDASICLNCRKELHQPQNRRYCYPFITCTNCGPRYSIVQQLPYDRETTTMSGFNMCKNCSNEYNLPGDKRYFSQTNSCEDCKISLTLYDKKGKVISKQNSEIIQKINDLWKTGKIVAIKGIGGYILTCDAHNPLAIKNLRQLKHRPSKPFALMFPNEKILLNEVMIQEEAINILKSPVAPIVILNLKNNINTNLATAIIAPRIHQIGCMLPYAPLYDLLLRPYGQPIVATSGNRSKAPIVFEDIIAKKELSNIADYILINNRPIVVPQDDSVIRFSFFKRHKIIIRRSRGLAPTYINSGLDLPPQTILATGADLKSTFTFLYRGNPFISQYLGDLSHFDTLENYKHTLQHFLQLFETQPSIILSDKHPEYAATQLAFELKNDLNIPSFTVQHHIAHFCAVLGENNLIDSKEPVLGVIWDGTGYGEDGQIWGGEFFIYDHSDIKRTAHIAYFNAILGDKMPKEPRISALSICWDIPEAQDILQPKFSPTEWKIYHQLIQNKNQLKTSSMGRIFDAVATLLNIIDYQTYEGEAAMLLENHAFTYFQINGLDSVESYPLYFTSEGQIAIQKLMRSIIIDIQDKTNPSLIAARFHLTLVQYIGAYAKKKNISKIAFSGGVFQNGLLVDLLLHHWSSRFELFFHQELSPNDENISFGQLIYYQMQQGLA